MIHNTQTDRIRKVVEFWKHCYIVCIIKNDLELQKANQTFNSLLFDKQHAINTELIYLPDINECARFFGFIAQKTFKFNNTQNNQTNIGRQLNLYLSHQQRIIEILLNGFAELNENEILMLLNSFKNIQQISNASIQQLTDNIPLHPTQIQSIYNIFNSKKDKTE